MADEHDVPPELDHALSLAVNLGHQRAGRVEKGEAAFGRFVRHGLGDAMRGEDDGNAVGHLIQFLHKHRAFVAQHVDDEAIVDDFVPNIDGCAIFGDRQFHDLNGTVDPGAEAARRGDDELEFWL